MVREIREELGCGIAVDRLARRASSRSATTHVLRVAVCHVVDGEPATGDDHDELRWLPARALDEVDWLEPDRPFLPAVRRLLLGSEA